MVSAADILNARILIVDDREANVRLLESTLRGAGYASVASTMDPCEVCELHRKNRYDLILLDLQMPGMDGFQVMEGLTEFEAGGYLPVLVLTALPEHKLRALHAGAKDFVSTPFDLVEVQARVYNMIEVRLLNKEAKNHAKMLEQTLRDATERLYRTMNAAKVGLWERNLITNEIHYSPECRHQLGYGDDEINDDKNEWTELLHPDDRDRALDFTARYIDSQSFIYSHEFRLRHKDGSYCWILAQGSVLLDEEGRPSHLLGSHTDITARKRLEEQFQQSQKMESIGRLAGGIAHDFNNLLSVIIGYTNLAMETVPEGDPLREDLAQIGRAGNRAAELTQQLLAFSRKQILRMQVFNLNSVLLEAQKMLRRLISEDIELVFLLSDNLGNVEADPGQIGQVIMNLAINARDSMPTGGKLTIETRNEQVDKANSESHASLAPGPYVTLMVSDTGCGMDAPTIRQAFEPFFTTKEIGKGTGLGLSTVYGIINQSSGSVQVRSELGLGTTFKILLPRVEGTVPVAQPLQMEARNQGSGVILLVEDDDAMRSLTSRILTRAGYTVVAASGGFEALAICETEDRLVRLLITDVVMPRMSGPELAERLKGLGKRVKTLYVSGYVDDAVMRHKTIEKNVNFLSKPFTAVALTQKVCELLNVIST